MITRVSHLTILVKDQDDALAFYKDKLGFKVHTDAMFGDMRWLTLCTHAEPNFEIVLMKTSPAEQDLVGKQAGPYPLFNFETDDCRATYKKLSENGVVFEGEPKEESWGIGVGFKDLYGNMIYMNQNF